MAEKRRVTLIVSVDTEEDNWVPTSRGIETTNIRELTRLAGIFEDLGIRATYFTTYQVASDPEAAAVLREIAGDTAEIGAHLHPWNTPPEMDDALGRYGSMLFRYPPELQQAKLQALTDVLGEQFDGPPRTFRAGRFGMGRSVVGALQACGYHTDSSVTPFLDWTGEDGDGEGPDFTEKTPGLSSIRGPFPGVDTGSAITEVPITVGFTRFAPATWPRLASLYHNPVVRALAVSSIAARTGLLARVIMSPETTSRRAMIALARSALKGPLPYLHMFLHSSTMKPGLNPFTPTSRDLDRLLDRIVGFVEYLASAADLSFATVGEASRTYREGERA